MSEPQPARALLFDPRKRFEHKIKAALREQVSIATETNIATFCNTLSMSPPDIVFLAVSPNDVSESASENELKDRLQGLKIPVLCISSKSSKSYYFNKFEMKAGADVIESTADKEEYRWRVRRLLNMPGGSFLTAKEAKKHSAHLIPELHDYRTGRIDARKVSKFYGIALTRLALALDALPSTIHKTPASPALQEKLGIFERIAAGVVHYTGSASAFRIWLNNQNPDLGNQTPLSIILEKKKPDEIANLVEDILLGQPG